MEGEGSSSSRPIVITDSPKCSPVKITKRAAEYGCVPGMAVGTLYVCVMCEYVFFHAHDQDWQAVLASLSLAYVAVMA